MPVAFIGPEELYRQPGPYSAALEAAGFELLYPDDPTFTRGLVGDQATIEQLRDCDAILAGGEFFRESVLAALPRLRVIARCGVGYDRVDVPAATARGVAVTITPNSNHECVAEHALSLMFAVARGTIVNDRRVRSGAWRGGMLQPLRTRTLGILGLGRIGRSLAVRAIALGMRVIAHEPVPGPDFCQRTGVELVDFEELLARSDFLSVHCPHTAETTGLFNQRTFARMKRGSVLINTARGKLVVESDLIEALRSGQLSGAGLDVFEDEPPPANHPLFALDQVVLAPHIGGADWLSVENMASEAAECIVRLSRGEWPAGKVVNDELRARWQWQSHPGGGIASG